jgi:hypothetical protein
MNDTRTHLQRTLRRVGLPVAALVLAGCLGCSDAPTEDPPAQVPENRALDACGFTPSPSANIDISERSDVWHQGTYSRIEARVAAGTEPKVHAVVLEEGNCRLLELMYGACTDPCSAADVCTSDNHCASEPEGLSAGTLTVRGLASAAKIESQSWSPGRYDSPSLLENDLFANGDTIEIELQGEDFPALLLEARGVASMDPDLTANGYEMTNGQDAEVTWTPGPNPDACIALTLKGRNTVHGAPLGSIIECFGSDTGSLTVPRAIVEAFPIGETPEVTNGFDWPHSELSRYTRTSLDTVHGPAALTVRSTTYFQMSHPE